MSKYAPLGAFLRTQTKTEIPMSFDEVERVLGLALPPSARYPAWWSNNSFNNVMTDIWLAAGFRTERVDVPGRKLVFRRVEDTAASVPVLRHTEATREIGVNMVPTRVRRHPIFGCMTGFMTISPGTDVTAPADPSWGRES